MNDVSTTIRWADKTWNPFVGCLGPNNDGQTCSYCYAAVFAERFRGTKAFPNGFTPTWHPERLKEPKRLRKPTRIFTGSVTDMFGSWVSQEQFDQVMYEIQTNPHHTFYMLTKQPENIADKLQFETANFNTSLPFFVHSNLWIGATVDTQQRADQTLEPMMELTLNGWYTFVSIEPMLTAIAPLSIAWADWIIIGAMTGQNAKKYQPEKAWIQTIVDFAHAHRIPLFIKDNVKWPLKRQEWPKPKEKIT